MDITKFLLIENRYDLYNLKIDNVNYWNYIRFDIWNYNICSQLLQLEEAHNKVHKSFKTYLNLLKYSIAKGRVKKCPFIIFNHNRRVYNGDHYECIYTDKIIKDCYDAIFFEEAYQYKHFLPAASEFIFYTDRINILSTLWLRFYKLFYKNNYYDLNKSVKEQLYDAISELKQAYNWSGSIDLISEKCSEIIIRHKFEKNYYKKLLNIIKPKIILEVVSYRNTCMIVNELAKEMGITTIELQHGVMHKDHAAYHYFTKEKIVQLPDKLFVFSDYWKKCISFPIGDENIVTTGFPHYESKRDLYINSTRIDKRKTIIFLSQGTIGQQLSKLASDLCSKLDLKDYRLIYKLHPAEYETWEKDLPLLMNNAVEVIDDRSVDLYKLFSQSDFQIGVYSTALFEGLGFGLKTLIYKVGHYDTMLPLINLGYAELFSSVEDCIRLLNEESYGRRDASVFWANNSLSNIRNEIDNILKKSGDLK